ncbi:MAG: rubrerythrin [Thermofilum sp.]|nr:rubrerythrin [Thermofilum sp.]
MLAKNPLEMPPEKKLTREGLIQAIRLSVIAELDAINLYLQFASATDDPLARKVFEDIAREEKTHVGEFLALLEKMDIEQVKELEKGRREVSEMEK